MHGWNGSILESPAITVTSDGATITLSVEKSGGGNLTVVFSDGYYAWTTAPDTITLTAGTDTSPQINYVYFLQSTKVLTVNTSDWPSEEHAPIATVICQSAASLQTDGAYKVHAWTDHVTRSDDQGHVADLNFWIRNQNATWIDGVSQTYNITTNGGAPDNVILTTSSGNVLQLHSHVFPAFSGTPDIYVVNDSVTPYTKITDLNAALTDSTGSSLTNSYFSLVIWGVVSEAEADCKLFMNLPSGSYGNAQSLADDANKYANYNIPTDYRGTGFLISQWDLRHQNASGGTWTSMDEVDLRGLIPSQAAGGTTAPGTEFIDNVFRILDDGDNSKEIAFQADQITTATTRTITMADQDISLIPGVTFEPACTWTEVTGTSQAMAVNGCYIANNAALVTLTLPDTAAIGEVVKVLGKGAGLFKIAQNAGDTIHGLSSDTTTGVGGSLTATEQYGTIELRCITANTDWIIVDTQGNFTVV